MPRTLYDKLFDQHIVAEQENGEYLLYIDRHLIHEVSSPQAFAGLTSRNIPVRRPDLTLATCDHNVPTTAERHVIRNPESRLQVKTLSRNVAKYGIPYFGVGSRSQGIVHVIGPELGFTLPGTTVVCGDSHTSTHGAFGCLAFGIGTTEVEHVLATQTIGTTRWRNMRITVHGSLLNGVTSKDLMLFIIGKLGTATGTGAAIEFSGSTIDGMSMEARMSLCNMGIEAGARACIIAPDQTTFTYLKARRFSPDLCSWDSALKFWETLQSDPEAHFEEDYKFDATEVVPTVSWGTSPEQVVEITGRVPYPDSFTDEAKRKSCLRALEYMGLAPGTKVTDITIDKIFIGSCTNARIEDLRSAAQILRNQKISKNIKAAIVVPGSGTVKWQAEDEGLDEIFKDAGFEWRESGCSLCVGLNDDQLGPFERAASTSNRNFENRQGLAGRTHLLSPAMAAAAAISGTLSDVRSLGFYAVENGEKIAYSPRESKDVPSHLPDTEQDQDEVPKENDHIAAGPFISIKGIVAHLNQTNVDTDCILPKQFCTTIKRKGLSDGLFYHLRRDPNGSFQNTFVLNQSPFEKASILCSGPNFGCGSSREHAVWALLDFGIRCVLAPSFADIFYNNAVRNGLLPAIVDEQCLRNVEKEALFGHTIKVDLQDQVILDENNCELGTFKICARPKSLLLQGKDQIGISLDSELAITHFESYIGRNRPWIHDCISTGWKKVEQSKHQSNHRQENVIYSRDLHLLDW